MRISFEVHGKPVPEGSTGAIPYKRRDGSLGVNVMHSRNGTLLEWRNAVADAYLKTGGEIAEGPVAIQVIFLFNRPKTVSIRKRPFMTVKPDLDKLCRAIGDALSGVAYSDDAQIVRWEVYKMYVDQYQSVTDQNAREGVLITISDSDTTICNEYELRFIGRQGVTY